MRLGVLSDTHGRIEIAIQAIQEMGEIDLLIHAGDHYNDAISIGERLKIAVEAVKGNCDHFLKVSEEKTLEIEGKKIFLTHGHKFNVKSNYLNLKYKGLELDADLVIFGHTHIAEIIEEEKIMLFNPGSIALPRFKKYGTYGIIEITKNEIKPYIKEFSGE